MAEKVKLYCELMRDRLNDLARSYEQLADKFDGGSASGE